ncbi:MAG: VWA domain-containing protein [Deltaproteobacteria bacterium]|nr:VWA domain-containing protein [Deltaproteobacteria bacterium]
MKPSSNIVSWIAAVAGITAAFVLSACGATGDTSSGGNVSTGGAQDIGVFRAILDQGDIPGPNTLDANGFFSEHTIELPPPQCGKDVCVHGLLSIGSSWVDGSSQTLLEVALNTTIDATGLERKPLNLVVVVDQSGSMASDDKMGYVIDGIQKMIDEMQPGDRMALISYATNVYPMVGLSDEQDATSLHAAVARLQPSGSTDIYDGLQAGLQMSSDNLDDEHQNRVIFLSDGVPTVGVTDSSQILEMADPYLADGIGLTTIGVGTDINLDLMRGLAEKGSGNFYFLEDPAAVREVFTEEMSYFITPIAMDVQIEVRSGAAYKLGSITGAVSWQTEGYGGSIEIPSIFLASRVDGQPNENGRRGGGSKFFVEFEPNGSYYEGMEHGDVVAEVTLSYLPVGATERVEETIVVRNPYGPGSGIEYYSDITMDKAAAMYNMYRGLLEACRLAEYDYNQALWTVQQSLEAAQAWNRPREDADLASDIELAQQFQSNLEDRGAVAYDPSMEGGGCGPNGDEICTGGIACSATGNSGENWLWVLMLAGLVLGLSLRRRLVHES